MTKVSPGPWVITDRNILDANGNPVLVSRVEYESRTRDHAEIDIFEAPDERAILNTPRTLELLRRFVDELQYTAWVTEPIFTDTRALLAEIEGE